MKKVFADKSIREVPKCKECKSDKFVVLSTYDLGDRKDLYWECERCYCVVSRISKFSLD